MKKIQVLAFVALLVSLNNTFGMKSELETGKTNTHAFDSCTSSDCLDCQKNFAPASISLSELSSRAFDLKFQVKAVASTALTPIRREITN